MSLSLGERRRLRKIERSLAGSDSRLTSLYTIFNRLARVDAMPARERVRILLELLGGTNEVDLRLTSVFKESPRVM